VLLVAALLLYFQDATNNKFHSQAIKHFMFIAALFYAIAGIMFIPASLPDDVIAVGIAQLEVVPKIWTVV